MIVSYVDLLGGRQRHQIEVEVTADHPASSYGIPVVVLPDGESLSIESWIPSTIKLRRPRQKSLMRSRLP